MGKFDEAIGRMFNRVFVCRNCKTKIKTDKMRILKKEIICKKCGSDQFRPIKKSK
ncbi:MAG TPA: hypothetical protein HA362_04940 [Nanoarchaeota archaeon]|nr:hypothetical protein [Nanoarchaeota archaeon]